MKWYTLENGRLCLGTTDFFLANFHVATDIYLEKSYHEEVKPEHIRLIGSYPEDWFGDELIDEKVNQAAETIFT